MWLAVFSKNSEYCTKPAKKGNANTIIFFIANAACPWFPKENW